MTDPTHEGAAVSTDPTDKAARALEFADAFQKAWNETVLDTGSVPDGFRIEGDGGVSFDSDRAAAFMGRVLGWLPAARPVATTGDTPRTLPEDWRSQLMALQQAIALVIWHPTTRLHSVRHWRKMPAPKFNVGDDVLYGSWTTPRTIHRRYWDDEADSWVYCAAREGMASVEASEDRLTLAAVAGVPSRPGAQPGEAQA